MVLVGYNFVLMVITASVGLMFDVFVYCILFIFSFIAFLRGFIKELLSIVGHFAAFYFSYAFHDQIKDFAANYLHIQAIAPMVLYSGAYFALVIALWVVNSIVCMVLLPIRLGFIDRLFGILLGLTKGFAFCFVASVILTAFLSVFNVAEEEGAEVPLPLWLADSRMYSVFGSVRSYVDKQMQSELLSGVVGAIGKQALSSSESDGDDFGMDSAANILDKMGFSSDGVDNSNSSKHKSVDVDSSNSSKRKSIDNASKDDSVKDDDEVFNKNSVVAEAATDEGDSEGDEDDA